MDTAYEETAASIKEGGEENQEKRKTGEQSNFIVIGEWKENFDDLTLFIIGSIFVGYSESARASMKIVRGGFDVVWVR